MAKYTKCDDEVKELTENDRVNYNYFLLKYNVDKQQQVTEGLSALKEVKEPMNIIAMLKNPKKISTLLTAIVMMLIVVSLVIFIIWYYAYKALGWKLKQELLTLGMPVVLGCFFLVSFIGLMYGVIQKEIMKAYMMIPQKEKPENVLDVVTETEQDNTQC
jgi:uncharacterized membrane protein